MLWKLEEDKLDSSLKMIKVGCPFSSKNFSLIFLSTSCAWDRNEKEVSKDNANAFRNLFFIIV